MGENFADAFNDGVEQARRRWETFGQEGFQAIPEEGTLNYQQECRLPLNDGNHLNGDDDITYELGDEQYFVDIGANNEAGMVADPDGKIIWIRQRNVIADPYEVGQKVIHEPTHSFLFRDDPDYNRRPPGYAHPDAPFKFGVDAIPLDSSWR